MTEEPREEGVLRRAIGWLSEERDAAGLAAFRVLFGSVVATSAGRFLAYGWVDEFFVKPRFTFHYLFAPGVPLLPAWAMHATFWVLLAAGVCVAA